MCTWESRTSESWKLHFQNCQLFFLSFRNTQWGILHLEKEEEIAGDRPGCLALLCRIRPTKAIIGQKAGQFLRLTSHVARWACGQKHYTPAGDGGDVLNLLVLLIMTVYGYMVYG